MKLTNALPVRILSLAVIIAGWAAVDAGNISYTYDPAGRLVAADYGSGKSSSYAYDNAGNLLLASEPAPSLILGPIMSGQFNLAWPSAPGPFTLESSSTLGPNASWKPVGAAVTQAGNLSIVTLSVGQTAAYYRLHK